jgi:hypothetical protein
MSYLSPSVKISYLIYGGIFVPVATVVIGKLIHAAWLIKSPYAVLAAIAPFMELAAIPIMILLRDSQPAALPGILMLCEGVHYLIYMWLHMDYYFFNSGICESFSRHLVHVWPMVCWRLHYATSDFRNNFCSSSFGWAR